MAFDARDVGSGGDGAERLEAIRSAEGLAHLAEVTGADSEHAAYFEAKRDWADLRGAEFSPHVPEEGIPGTRVTVDGREFFVHGITHADTRAEGEFLRERVSALPDDAAVYCEQGIRGMYFAEFPEVCGMDDYLWAMRRCEELDIDSHVSGFTHSGVEGLVEDLTAVVSEFREATFSLIESNEGVYGERFKRALGDVASQFLMSHEDVATGDHFESFARNRRAAEDPAKLIDLQAYYERTFLPQPLEREWLRRHDRELEIVTHARNERMADYVGYHDDGASEVHVIVGAAHQPGVRYYLERHRDGDRGLGDFEPMG